MTFEQIAKKATNLSEAENAAIAKKLTAEYADVLKSMNEKLEALYAKLAGVAKEDYFNVASQYSRLANLIDETQTQYLRLSRLVGKQTESAAINAIKSSFYKTTYVANWVADKTIKVALSPDVIAVSVYGTPEAWAKIKDTAMYGRAEAYLPKSGTLLSELIKKRNKPMLQNIERTIRAGLMNGDSVDRVARKLRDLMESDAYQATRIAQTETHRNMMSGQYAADMALDNEGLTTRRMWVATLDGRTRDSHQQMDGQLEDDDGYFHLPDGTLTIGPGMSGEADEDINCRCATIMTVDGKSPELRRGRDPVTGETDIISWTTYSEWSKEKG